MKEYVYRLKSVIKKFKTLYDDAHIAEYSAQAAFFTMVSAVPLAMFIIILLGALAPFDIIGVGEILSHTFTGQANGYVMEIFNEITSYSTVPLASVTMVFLVWAATRGIRSIANGIEAIYECHDNYNIVQLTIRAVVYTVLMVLVCIASALVLAVSLPLEKTVIKLLGENAGIILTVLNMKSLVLFLALSIIFAMAYKGLAKSKIRFVKHLPGAVIAAAGWILYSYAYSIYIRYFSNYSVLYGSFGAVMLFMLWLYMCMNILLCGALVNRILYRTKCD